MAAGEVRFQHKGGIYVRPVGRGICLVDDETGEFGDEQLEDLLPDGYYVAEIVIRNGPCRTCFDGNHRYSCPVEL